MSARLDCLWKIFHTDMLLLLEVVVCLWLSQHFKSLFPIVVALIFSTELLLTEAISCPGRTLLSTVLDYVLEQWFSVFLTRRPLVSHVVRIPNHEMMSLPLHDCNFVTTVNRNVSEM